MYINYIKKGNYEYATACHSSRNGNKVGKDDQIYLGRVIDKKKGIYKSRERGVFLFDPDTKEFSPAPEDVVPKVNDKRRNEKLILDFGNSYFLNRFIKSKNYDQVINSIPFSNKDTLLAMISFYALENLANTDAYDWYQSNFVKYLYPHAGLDSRRISEFMQALGREENYRAFFPKHVEFVRNNISEDKGILIDSSGIPNSIHFPLTAISTHNGNISNEVRLIAVTQKSTGLPLLFRYVPGNIVDVNTIVRTVEEMQQMNIDVDYCLMDAGYYNDLIFDTLDFAEIDFMTRMNSGHEIYKNLINEHMASLERPENLVKYNGRLLYIKKTICKVGEKRSVDAYAYICKDIERSAEESKKIMKKIENEEKIDSQELHEKIKNTGLFILITTKEMKIEEVLPGYYVRQQIEQIFDIEKNYAHLVPARVHSEETFRGHLLLSFITSVIIKMLQDELKKIEMTSSNLFLNLRSQKCKVYDTVIITDEPVKKVNDIYKEFYITCPSEFILVGEELKEDTRFVKHNEKKKRGRPKKTK